MISLILWLIFVSYYSLGSVLNNKLDEGFQEGFEGIGYAVDNKSMFIRMIRGYNKKIMSIPLNDLNNLLLRPLDLQLSFSFRNEVKESFKILYDQKNQQLFEKSLRLLKEAFNEYLIKAAECYLKMPIFSILLPENEKREKGLPPKTIYLFSSLLSLNELVFKEDEKLNGLFSKCKEICFDPSDPVTEEFISLLYPTGVGQDADAEKSLIRKEISEFQIKLFEIEPLESKKLYYLLEKHYLLSESCCPFSKEFSSLLDAININHPEKFHRLAQKFNVFVLGTNFVELQKRYKRLIIIQSLISKHSTKEHNRMNKAKSSNFKWMNSIILERSFYMELAFSYVKSKVPANIYIELCRVTENLASLVWCLKSMPRSRQSLINGAYLEFVEECSKYKEYQDPIDKFKALIHDYSPAIGKQARLIYEQNKKLREVKELMESDQDFMRIIEGGNGENPTSLIEKKIIRKHSDLKEGVEVFNLSFDCDYLTMCEKWVIPMISRNLDIMREEKFALVQFKYTELIDVGKESKNYQLISRALEFVESKHMPDLKTLVKCYLKKSDPIYKAIFVSIKGMIDIGSILSTYKFREDKMIQIELPPFSDESSVTPRRKSRRRSNVKIGVRKNQELEEAKKTRKEMQESDLEKEVVIPEKSQSLKNEQTEAKGDKEVIGSLEPRRAQSHKESLPPNDSDNNEYENIVILPIFPVILNRDRKPTLSPKLPRQTSNHSRSKRRLKGSDRSKSQSHKRKSKLIN